jgi:hypothetical protein
MSKDWLYVIPIVVFLVQLCLCFCGQVRWLRVLPVILLSALSGGSLAFYFYSGFTNWAWLLLVALLSWCSLAAVAAWMVFGLYRLVKKVLHI